MGDLVAAASSAPLLTASGTKLKASDLENLREYLLREGAPSTRRAYQAHWRAFESFCKERETVPVSCSPEIVAAFLGEMAQQGRAASSVAQARAAIHKAHELLRMMQRDPNSVPDPTTHPIVKKLMSEVSKDAAGKVTQKMALTIPQVRSILGSCSDDIRGVRDRAMIAMGILSAMRRSEIVSLEVSQLVFDERGITVTLGKTKTDQQGKGAVLAIPRASSEDICPVALTQRWLDETGIESGPVFRGIHPQGRILDKPITATWFVLRLKQAAKDAGLPEERIAGHSLRSGFVTEAAKRGASILEVSEVTRHRDLNMVKRYYRNEEAWSNNAAKKLGL